MPDLTTDRNDPDLQQYRYDGQQQTYLILSEEERASWKLKKIDYEASYKSYTLLFVMYEFFLKWKMLSFEEWENHIRQGLPLFSYVDYNELN